MKKNFINISNHPSSGWGTKQLFSAGVLGAPLVTKCCRAATESPDEELIFCAQCGAEEPEMTPVILDIPFPRVPADAGTEDIIKLAKSLVMDIRQAIGTSNISGSIIHLMGEQSLCFILAQMLIHQECSVVVSTTERIVETDENGVKKSTFRFVRFRPLQLWSPEPYYEPSDVDEFERHREPWL